MQLSGGLQLLEETAHFAYLHAAAIPATELKNKAVVHIWNDKFSDMREAQPQEEDKIKTKLTLDELADEQICRVAVNMLTR